MMDYGDDGFKAFILLMVIGAILFYSLSYENRFLDTRCDSSF